MKILYIPMAKNVDESERIEGWIGEMGRGGKWSKWRGGRGVGGIGGGQVE